MTPRPVAAGFVGPEGCPTASEREMNGYAASICTLVVLACLRPAPRATASDEASDPPKAQQVDRAGKDDHAHGIEFRYDEKSQRFIFRNAGKRPVWYYAYNPTFPFSSVERLTADGWVETTAHFCGVGTEDFRLDPGQQVAFVRSLKTSSINLDPCCGNLRVRYPELETLPVRVGLLVFREENNHASGGRVWSETWDGPIPASPKN
jgi:hypothetical protein